MNVDRDTVLIADCTACIDPRLSDEEGRQEEGIREWTVRFRSVPDPDHPGFNMLEPENERDLMCPECGSRGRIWPL